MKLGEMKLDDSKSASMLILPEIEKLRADTETAELLDTMSLNSGLDSMIASESLMRKLLNEHFETTCKILAILEQTNVETIKKEKTRNETKVAILEMLSDEDLISFFISSASLIAIMQSATLPSASLSHPVASGATLKARQGKKST